MVFFSFGWTPLQAIYQTEVLPYQNRAKGLALSGWVSSAVSLINTFGLPSALSTLRWKSEPNHGPESRADLVAYLIFMAWDLVGIVVIYLYVVETKMLSLEDLDEVFPSKNPKQMSFDLARDARITAKEEKQRRTHGDF